MSRSRPEPSTPPVSPAPATDRKPGSAQRREKSRILLVDDDADLLHLISVRLKANNYDVCAVNSGKKAMAELARYQPDAVVTDLRMPDIDGMELFEEIQRRHVGLPVIILTAHANIADAVEATRKGIFSYLAKPFDPLVLLASLEKMLQQSSVQWTSASAADRDSWRQGILTRSQAMEALLRQARVAAVSDASILIQSQTGTGKELLARAIHRASPRASHTFMALNCAAIPETLIESELFGHAAGSFTGATRAHTGLFEAAAGGTIFLDEIGDMPLTAQAKLLRVIEEREVRPVGSTQTLPVDVRIIAATHYDLKEKIQTGTFREDLYYRLNVFTLEMPPLSERREDIMLLANHFAASLAARSGKPVCRFSPEAAEALMSAPWPGNVRQLYNVVEHCVVLSSAPMISRNLVERALRFKPQRLRSLNEALETFERDYLLKLLNLTEGNISLAARIADRNRSEFYNLLKRHGLEPREFRKSE